MLADRSDQTFLFKVNKGGSGQRSVDSKSITENTWSDHLHLRNLHKHLVVRSLGVQDVVVNLLLRLSLGPLLLLSCKGGRRTKKKERKKKT